MLGGYEGFSVGNANDLEIPIMHSQRLDMSPNEIMGTRPGQSGEGRNASSESKREWGG